MREPNLVSISSRLISAGCKYQKESNSCIKNYECKCQSTKSTSRNKGMLTSTSSGGSSAREVSGRPAPSTFLLAPDFVGAAFLLAG
jgi:hypothetical protein